MPIDTFSEFGELTPTEVAILWMSSNPSSIASMANHASISVYGDKVQLTIPVPPFKILSPYLVASKRSLILGCILAEGYASVSGDIPIRKIFDDLDEYARNKASMISEDPFWELPVGQPYGDILDLFKMLEYQSKFPLMAPVSSDLIYMAKEKCSQALKFLSQKGLVLDPPWLELSQVGAMIMMLGAIPLDISVKTKKGEELVKQLSVKATLWEFERTISPQESHWRFNLKIAQFVGSAIAHLATRFLEYWQRSHPEIPPISSQNLPRLDSDAVK